MWRNPERGPVCRAGVLAAATWVLGMGVLAFDAWVHSAPGEASLARFSVHHPITSARAYATAFVLMAFAPGGAAGGHPPAAQPAPRGPAPPVATEAT